MQFLCQTGTIKVKSIRKLSPPSQLAQAWHNYTPIYQKYEMTYPALSRTKD